jgi:hypothetical protein
VTPLDLGSKEWGLAAAKWSVTTDRPMLTPMGTPTTKWKESSIYKRHRRKRWTDPRYAFHYWRARRQMLKEIRESDEPIKASWSWTDETTRRKSLR